MFYMRYLQLEFIFYLLEVFAPPVADGGVSGERGDFQQQPSQGPGRKRTISQGSSGTGQVFKVLFLVILYFPYLFIPCCFQKFTPFPKPLLLVEKGTTPKMMYFVNANC